MNPTPAKNATVTRRSTFAGMLLGALALLFGLTSAAPAAAQTYCPTYRRDCVVFVAKLSSSKMSPVQKAFYDFVQFSASGMALTTLTPRYRKVHVVEGSAATREALWKKLDQVSRNGDIWAVDLIFVGHGLDAGVQFTDQTVAMSVVRDDILQVPSYYRKKLRVVFDTSCYSSSHRAYWIGAGFKSASGSRRIYADSIASYPAFLMAWASNGTFYDSVQAANAADPARLIDQAAKQVLLSWGYSKWWDVDSYRLVSGSYGMRIYHRPY